MKKARQALPRNREPRKKSTQTAPPTIVAPRPKGPVLEYGPSELVFGLVYAVGTDYRRGVDSLSDQIRRFGYQPVEVRLSEYLEAITDRTWSTIHERINTLMDVGDEVRERSGRGDFVALSAIAKIAADRRRKNKSRTPRPVGKVAYILYSLKHEEEVAALRQVYGSGFHLIAFFAPERQRLRNLIYAKNVPAKQAQRLIERDQGDPGDFGQHTRKTFQLADFFVTADNCEPELGRLLDLVFGHPYTTPTPDEHAMYFAYAASLRSGQLGRQVGAAIISSSGDLIAVGCNEVPKAGGGLYWPGDLDQRDHVLGLDSNDQTQDVILDRIMKELKPELPQAKRLAEGKRLLKGTGLFDITEYGRAVHAEMDALLGCSRSVTSPRQGTLYTTTFPCHNCTRHIIVAGIQRVVYIEPYPKSKATELHPDAISVEAVEEQVGSNPAAFKIPFESFIGVGPRRFVQLFSMTRTLGGGYEIVRKKDGKIVEWDPMEARPRVPILPTSYLQREQLASELFRDTMVALESNTT